MRVLIAFIFFSFAYYSFAQQVPDLNYNPKIENPVYRIGTGSVIMVDEGHNNFHTKNGRYSPFAKVLEKDGYTLKAYEGVFESKRLEEAKILVIANPLNEINIDNWTLPNPSAFTEEEILILDKWVRQGGSLFLIADHMPFPGATERLAATFGFEFVNGFNVSIVNPAFFWRANQTIATNIITTGRDSTETINKIPMTEGQAFRIPPDAEPILIFDKRSIMLIPDTAWVFRSDTPLMTIEGLSQGAFKKHENGKVVVFGEASMFTAQIGDPGRRKMGMNNENSEDNYKLLLNVIHWLDGLLD